MRFETLDEWLDWQLSLHMKSIDLGLERVGKVAARLNIGRIATKIITVAGTNGKGSTVASYETWLHNAGYSVASYTSPHLLRYNERIKLDLEMATDEQLCEVFEMIDQARKDVPLTYFEFGTLAAILLIERHQPDFAILEVGLGGRLDAVNLIDADLVHLTSIGLDHQSWLGDDREKIGFEKAGVLRQNIPVVCNDPQLPRSVEGEIDRLSCRCMQYQRDFFIRQDAVLNQYLWQAGKYTLPVTPVLPGVHQVQNLAGVIAGLSLLLPLGDMDSGLVAQHFNGTELGGRFQQLPTRLAARVYVDVGHNVDAALALEQNLRREKSAQGRVIVLLGMLEDKDSASFVDALQPVVDAWWLLSLDCDRGQAASELSRRIVKKVSAEKQFQQVDQALEYALSSLSNQDIILVTGSFVTVELFLRATQNTPA